MPRRHSSVRAVVCNAIDRATSVRIKDFTADARARVARAAGRKKINSVTVCACPDIGEPFQNLPKVKL